MRFLEVVVLRAFLWVGLPLCLIVLAIGPIRVWRWWTRFWNWLRKKRLEPEEILTHVVKQHERHIAGLRKALARAESAEMEIIRNIDKSRDNIAALEKEAQGHVQHDDDLGARAALYK